MSFYALDRREFVVIGIGHLSEKEAARPAAEWPALCFEAPEHGFIVYVEDWQEAFDCVVYEGDKPVDRRRGSWPGLVAAMKWAAKHEIHYLRFDRDTEKLAKAEAPELRRFEW